MKTPEKAGQPKHDSGPCPATFAQTMSIIDVDDRAREAYEFGYRGIWLYKATAGNSWHAEMNRMSLHGEGFFASEGGS